MSVVTLLGAKILNNPAKFSDPYQFEITFECLEPLQKGKSSQKLRAEYGPRLIGPS
jgi:ASF1 like histone chaperone